MSQALGCLFDIVEGFPCVDLSTGANTGDWVNCANAGHVVILFGSGVGTAGDDPTLTVLQASDNAATGSKALNVVTDPIHVWKKQAATSLASTTVWSDASGDASTNAVTNATSAEQSALWVVEFDTDMLDVDNGFDHISCTVADVGCNAQPGFLLYFLTEMRYPDSPDTLSLGVMQWHGLTIRLATKC